MTGAAHDSQPRLLSVDRYAGPRESDGYRSELERGVLVTAEVLDGGEVVAGFPVALKEVFP